MAEIRVTPANADRLLADIAAGDQVTFAPGHYREPLKLSSKTGSAGRPITLRAEPGAVIGADVAAEDFRAEGNRKAKCVEDDGKYPGLWPWMTDGRLVLEHCRHIVIEGLIFERSWPTHIALDDCQDIEIANCDFTDATFAIAATGRRTHGIVIRHCSWLQDRTPWRIWHQIPWERIHGAKPEDPPVDIERDWRLFDGDFFRGDGIKGGVTIEHCRIGQAFNAIHLFNDEGDPDLACDVVVRDCTFFQIRDNVLEAETVARNWWFYRNKLFNVHKWFSIECQHSRHFYLFANLAWFNSIQGPAQGDDNRGGGVFKLAKTVCRPFGPHYIFHNSFVTRSDYARNGVLAGMKHFNNAILCVARAGPDFDRNPNFFGDLAATAPAERFTTEWRRYGIAMHHDVVRYPDWPRAMIAAGYPIGGPPLGLDPGFAAPFAADLSGTGLRLAPLSPCRAAASAGNVDLPGGDSWSWPAGGDIGAWQGEQLFAGPPTTAGLSS